ncbi:hypothetical protein J2W79_000826 [Methylorubrum extorquens]|nr:hypothetical protein [Methylorubrum extorquens]
MRSGASNKVGRHIRLENVSARSVGGTLGSYGSVIIVPEPPDLSLNYHIYKSSPRGGLLPKRTWCFSAPAEIRCRCIRGRPHTARWPGPDGGRSARRRAVDGRGVPAPATDRLRTRGPQIGDPRRHRLGRPARCRDRSFLRDGLHEVTRSSSSSRIGASSPGARSEPGAPDRTRSPARRISPSVQVSLAPTASNQRLRLLFPSPWCHRISPVDPRLLRLPPAEFCLPCR